MTEENQNFTVYDGDYVEINDTVTDSSDDVVDISNFGIQFTMANFAGGPVEIQKTETDGNVQITDGPNGRLRVTLEDVDTEGLSDGRVETYYYEIEVEDLSGIDNTVTSGEITVKPSY